MRIPTGRIDEYHLPRDRSVIDRDGLDELRTAILRDGLRTPIEVVETAQGYGLVSGFRRLMVVRELHDMFGGEDWATIEATLRTPGSRKEALRQMVEENAIRRGVRIWDQARIALATVPDEFDTLDAAVAALYGSLTRQRRHRIRAVAGVVEWAGDLLADPQDLSHRKLDRLAAAIAGGHGDLLEHALTESRTAASLAAQWAILAPILDEIDAANAGRIPRDPRPGRPRRFSANSRRIRIRRIWHPDGWTLKVTGPEATGMLMEDVMDEVERLVGG